MSLKVLELFGGIGACSKALEKIGIEYELADYVEIDKYAVQSFNAMHGTNYEPQDICQWDKDIEVDLIMHGSPCLIGGTRVITDTGYKYLEDITIGDKVLTHNNIFKPVVDKGSDGIKPIYKVETQGTLPIYCTFNHPFYVKHRTKYWNNEKRKYEYQYESPKKTRLYDMNKNIDYIGVPILPDVDSKLSELDSDTLWLLGRYVADGCYYDKPRKDRPSNTKYVSFSIGNSKINEFNNHVKSYKYYIDNSYKGCVQYRFGVDLTNLIINLNLGKGALDKRIPLEILQLPTEKLKIFLDGYMSGDGCSPKNTNHFQATTISRELAEGLVLAIQKVYKVGCSIYYDKRPNKYIIENREVNQHDTYMVRFNINPIRKPHYIVEENCIWYPIKRITNTKTEKKIYNITVEDDHTYTANNCYTEDCQDFSVAGKQAGGDKDSGTRSSLMYETLRIVGKLKPKYVIWENVKNVVSKKHIHNFDNYINDMQSLGYNNYWQVLNAKNYGIPQNRERVFVVSIRQDIDDRLFSFPQPFDLKIKLKDILEDNVSEKYYLTEDKINKIVHWKANQKPFERVLGIESIAPTLTARGAGEEHSGMILYCEELQDTTNLHEEFLSVFDFRYDDGVRGRKEPDISPTLTHRCGSTDPSSQPLIALKGAKVEDEKNLKQQLCEMLIENGEVQEFDVVKHSYSSDRMSGNSRAVECNNEMPTITTRPDTLGVVVKGKYILRIRKFTPKECWRLMGFDDSDIDKCIAIGMSDRQLYKQAGNSIVVNVLMAIFEELFDEF